jgi:hypothetical protein
MCLGPSATLHSEGVIAYVVPFPDTPPAPPAAFVAPPEVRLTEEDIRVADHTHMGMLGLYYLRPLSPNWLGGIAVFGAINGDHGGFFGWGISAAYQLRNGPWRAEAGLFAGGGGGSPGWVGGGLMLRPHVALTRTWGNGGSGRNIRCHSFRRSRCASRVP